MRAGPAGTPKCLGVDSVFWTFMRSRREFIELAAGFALAAQSAPAQTDVLEATIAQLQDGMTRGEFSSAQLVESFFARIQLIDRGEPKVNSIIEVNKDAVALAASLDRERREKGPRGPLHGIPVMIK